MSSRLRHAVLADRFQAQAFRTLAAACLTSQLLCVPLIFIQEQVAAAATAVFAVAAAVSVGLMVGGWLCCMKPAWATPLSIVRGASRAAADPAAVPSLDPAPCFGPSQESTVCPCTVCVPLHSGCLRMRRGHLGTYLDLRCWQPPSNERNVTHIKPERLI